MMNSADMVVRSSLEQMLESLQRRDENPKDVPPALPSRPTSIGRLPSPRRSRPLGFKVEKAVSGTRSWSQEKEREETEAVLNSVIFGNKRVTMVGQEESPYVKLPELESYEERSEEDDVSHSTAALSDSTVRFYENLRSWENPDFVLKKIAPLENARKNAIERIILVQKQYRGLQEHRHFQELKQSAIILQSFVRGYLARKKFCVVKSNGRERLYHEKINGEAHENLHEMKPIFEKHPQVQALALAELQRRALQAEAMLSQKEDECAALREKLQQSDIRWFENDRKMKSKEEMWQKQITSLQLSMVALKSSQPYGRRPDSSPVHHNHHNHDSEDGISTRRHTPGAATPPRQFPVTVSAYAGDYEGENERVGALARELEQRMRVFEDDARLIHQLNPEEEFRKLKARFNAWKKDFKDRLRKTKVVFRKSRAFEGDEKRKRWWVTRAIKL